MITGTTGCGMRYAVKRGGSAVGYCALSIRCGTRDEGGFHSGIAHFVEHTIFKGTLRKSSAVINSYLDKLGGELNAYTTKEEIVFHATVLKEDLSKAASLLFELATSATFPEKEIEKEKGVVIDEINSYKDSPSEDIYDRFEEMLFEGHPLSRPILGTASSVKKIDRAELMRFTGEKFTPLNMAFTVVADLPERLMEGRVRRLAERFFPDAAPAPAALFREEAAERFPGKLFDKSVNKRNHQANCVIGGTAPSLYDSRERMSTVLLCNILGGPASNSVLNSVLREKNGLVYGVECSYTQYADTGIAVISLGCDRSNLDRCVSIIDKEILRLQTSPLSPARMKAARKQLLGQLAISSDNGETQCLSMGKSLLAYGNVLSDGETVKMVEAVTADDVMAAASYVFGRQRCSRLVFL